MFVPEFDSFANISTSIRISLNWWLHALGRKSYLGGKYKWFDHLCLTLSQYFTVTIQSNNGVSTCTWIENNNLIRECLWHLKQWPVHSYWSARKNILLEEIIFGIVSAVIVMWVIPMQCKIFSCEHKISVVRSYFCPSDGTQICKLSDCTRAFICHKNLANEILEKNHNLIGTCTDRRPLVTAVYWTVQSHSKHTWVYSVFSTVDKWLMLWIVEQEVMGLGCGALMS